ncbi:MAG TPA: hypothetical protein EYN31_06685 [Candidatus Marinimicrobia bacterium]|jgi:galactokinase/mevalonate kinase-like predicted kinase|nr:hypothetical protein [Candidatus Neomarinimicrobiota bacterium]
MKQSFATALPRVSLIGNPSDIYGGFGLGFPIWNWQAKVFLDPSISSAEEMPLLQAARLVFSQLHFIKEEFGLRFISDIPLQAGLGGSSALVMAALRAMGKAHGLQWTWRSLADATLTVEQEHLGIIAGPMDRWIQAQEEFLWMDFSGNKTEVLPINTLPSLRVLISSKPGRPSGSVHAPIMERWSRGDPQIKRVMDAYRPLVEQGRVALLAGDISTLAECMDRNFELRASLFSIHEEDQAMINLCRRHGSAAKLCGSGGAVLALMKCKEEWSALEVEAKGAGITVVEPQLFKEVS